MISSDESWSQSPRIVGICDLGTFTGLLLFAAVRGRRLQPLLEERHTIDLVSRRPGVGSAALGRAEAVVRRFERLSRSLGCGTGLVICTAAIRTARNRARVLAHLRGATSHRVIVVSARQEAAMTAAGALSGLRGRREGVLVVDVGGGSTEVFDARSGRFRGVSLGAASATVAWSRRRPREKARRAAFYAQCARDSLAGFPGPRPPTASRVVGVGGTLVTLAALRAGVSEFEAGALHRMVLSRQWIEETGGKLALLEPRSIARLIPFDPERARVLTSGTFLWAELLKLLCAGEVTVSVRGLMWGAAARLAYGPSIRGGAHL